MPTPQTYAVHFAWIDGHSTKGPVGIWNKTGECYYPFVTAGHYQSGKNGFENRGQHSFESWLVMREEFPSTYGPSWQAVVSDEDMKVIIEGAVADFLATEHPTLHLPTPPPSSGPGVMQEAMDSIERFEGSSLRVEPPRQTTGVDHLRTWGGQLEWCWAVPLVLRALNSPRIDSPLPANPVGRSHPSMPDPGVLGYWAALQYTLTYSLGWNRHDRGLRAWYDAGKPTDSPALRLLSEVWDADGNLDAYVWWSHSPNGLSAGGALSREHGTVPSSDELSPPWSRQLEAFRRSALEREGLNEFQGPQPDGLHLEMGDHISNWGGLDQRARADGTLTVKSAAARRAVFEISSLAGWHTRLTQLGEQLPQDKAKSWHVDVYVQNVGYLGVYRRSWTTGVWFSGPHRYHDMGQD
jgi:hypothetical protein